MAIGFTIGKADVVKPNPHKPSGAGYAVVCNCWGKIYLNGKLSDKLQQMVR